MKQEIIRVCHNCRFYVVDSGQCRRYPPQVLAGAVESDRHLCTVPDDYNPKTFWPTTGPSDWCGEWSFEKPPEKKGVDNENDFQ